jgi:2-oxoglutarate dehydrogenase E2 component (dihydrolipoamide succinyltransferase)
MEMAEVVFDNVPEDVLHAVIEFWHFKEGDHVDDGDDLVDLKTEDGQSFTITSPVSGVLTERLYREDDEVEIGEVLAEVEEDLEVFDDAIDLDGFTEEDDEEIDDEELEEEEELEEGDEDDEIDEEEDY